MKFPRSHAALQQAGSDFLRKCLTFDASRRPYVATLLTHETIREHGASRVVLELDHVDTIDEALGGAIGEIGTRVRDAGGLIRICGLSEPKLSRLRSVVAAASVPHFDTRSDAVGCRGAGS